jgi:transcription termination/antitermination protein NusA
MDPKKILRVVDAIHRDKNIGKEIVFKAMEAALVSVSKKHYGDETDIIVEIDRTTGSIRATHNGAPMDTGEIVERIGAQAAKDAMVQKIREVTDPFKN